MSYKITLQDDADRLDLEMLQIPIADSYIEGASDNTTLDGNVYTDYLYLKHQWSQKWSRMDAETFARLKGFYERQFTTRKYPYYTLSDLQNTTDVRTESTQLYYGAPIEYTNGIAINSLEIKGATEQASYSGKNLFNKSTQTSGYLNNTGGISNTSSVSDKTSDYIEVLPNTSYTLSSPGWYLKIAQYNSSKAFVKFQSSGANITSNTVNTESSTRFIRISYGNAQINPNVQFEKGAAATGYEPYVGGTVSPNPSYPQEVKTVTGLTKFTVSAAGFVPQTVGINLGKNLFDKDNYKMINAFVSSDKILVQSALAVSVYISCEPNATYTVSKATGTNNRFCIFETEIEPAIGVAVTDFVGTAQGTDDSTSYSITTGASAKWLGVFIRVGNTTPSLDEQVNSIQIERGSEATTYARYFEPIELCKIGDYQDRIYKSGWRWFIERNVGKYTINSDDTGSGMTWESAKKRLYCSYSWQQSRNIAFIPQADATAPALIKSNNFISLSFQSLYNDGNNGLALSTSTTLSFRNDSWTDGDVAKANIVGTTLHYAMAAPVTEEITDSELIMQLDNALYSYLFDTNGTISATASNGLQAPLLADIAYWYYEHEPTPILHNKAVRMTLNSDGVVDCCGTQQNVHITLRETRND